MMGYNRWPMAQNLADGRMIKLQVVAPKQTVKNHILHQSPHPPHRKNTYEKKGSNADTFYDSPMGWTTEPLVNPTHTY